MQFNITTIMAVATIFTGAAATLTSIEGNSTSCYGACETDLKAALFGSSFQGVENSTLTSLPLTQAHQLRRRVLHYQVRARAILPEPEASPRPFRTFGLFEIDLLEKLFPESKESTGVFPYPSARPYRILKLISELHPYLSTLQATPPDKVTTSCYSVCEPVIEAFMFMDKHGADYHQELLYMEEADSEQIDETHAANIKSHGPRYWNKRNEGDIPGYLTNLFEMWKEAMKVARGTEETESEQQITETKEAKIEKHGPQYRNEGDESDVQGHLTDSSRCGLWL
ncbi:hypothetical protein LTR56_001977 [Elasticomyces elasticus]|nr:hypothetical protein LTR22_011562 [Elasticomyces elasticus]KAK3658121.1 hypothetical protein LTR56_001977 [Elasticomyces elasticus]KAK4914893.1 hypothetical protein LTR49_016882 [Elasticomyces elasticus]KAK5749131.1 hypothetical protein LTS12_020826 [Elasticomyces elasticus]